MIGLYLWVPILLAAAIGGALFRDAGFELPLAMVAPLATFAGLGMLASVLLSKHARMRRIGTVMNAFYQISVLGGAGMMLAYAAATTGRPLADGTLLALDRALGYDWAAYAGFFAAHRGTALIVLSAYFTLMVQPSLLILVTSAGHRTAQLEKFVMASFAATLLTVAVFAFYPATTAWAHIGVPDAELEAYRYLPSTHDSWVRDLMLIRAGGGRTLAEGFGSPLIAFPSLHCASGIVYMWAGWRVSWLRPILIVVNALMIAATPVIGGHYLTDLIAGAAVALAAIVLAEKLHPVLARQAERLRPKAGPVRAAPQLAWTSPLPVPDAEAERPAKAA